MRKLYPTNLWGKGRARTLTYTNSMRRAFKILYDIATFLPVPRESKVKEYRERDARTLAFMRYN